MKTKLNCKTIPQSSNLKWLRQGHITKELRTLPFLLIVTLLSCASCGTKPGSQEGKVACVSRTEALPRPAKPQFQGCGMFIKDAGNGWIEWEALLDVAQEDLRQCND